MNDESHIAMRMGRKSASLFEKFQAEDEEIDSFGGSDELAARIRSVKRNLTNVLNARSGGAQSAPEFGLGDLNDANVGSADMLRQVSKQIRSSIEVYEPRVTDVSVSFQRVENEGMELHFFITARTVIEHKNEQLTIDIVLTGNRGFELR